MADPNTVEQDGCPHFRNPDDCEQCWADIDNAAEISDLVDKAAKNIQQAMNAVSTALSAVSELTGRVYDIEFAEGSRGRDSIAELEQAARSLRHVDRLVSERKRWLDEEASRG